MRLLTTVVATVNSTVVRRQLFVLEFAFPDAFVLLDSKGIGILASV